MRERLEDDELYDEMYTLPKRGGKDTVDGPPDSGSSLQGSEPRHNRAGLAVRCNSSAVALTRKELSFSEEVLPKKSRS